MYSKTYLYRSKEYDLVFIEWPKGSRTKLHDHPKQGCHMICTQGKLQETHNGKITILNPYETIFRKGEDKHIIEAIEDSKSLHFYLPGFYNPTYYD